MITLILHGYLSSLHEGPIRIAANTVAEAIEGATRQIKGFAPHPVRGRHRVKAVGYETLESLYQPIDTDTEVHLVPQLNGGKEGGLGQILLGAVLIGIGFFLGGATWGPMLMKVGAMVLLGGIAQLLAPQPDASDANKNGYLGAPKNTVKIGTRIPILCGTYRVYGHILSFNINADTQPVST